MCPKRCSFRSRFLKYRLPLNSLNSFYPSTCAIVSVSLTTSFRFAAYLIELSLTFRFQRIACFPFPSFVSSKISYFVYDVASHSQNQSFGESEYNYLFFVWIRKTFTNNSFDCSLKFIFSKTFKIFFSFYYFFQHKTKVKFQSFMSYYTL